MNGERSRREFLTAGLAATRNGDSGSGQTDEASLNLSDHQRSYLESYKKNAMACEFELLFNLHQYKNASAVALNAFEMIDALEDQMTVYRPTSEVTYINEHAAKETVDVEAGLCDLLELSAVIHKETAGAFDITSWPLSELWGFSRRKGSVPHDDEIVSALEAVSGSCVELLEGGKVKFSKPEIKINLGGIGKGFALDRVVEKIEAQSIENFVIHGGQSSVVARGKSLEADGENVWKVGLSHPVKPGVRLAEISLSDSALGTSGTGRQGFFHQGKRYGHIIDPRTGWPTDHFLSTTVVCESAARADALATAFFVMQLDEIGKFCQDDESVKAIIVLNDSGRQQTPIEVFNMYGDQIKIQG